MNNSYNVFATDKSLELGFIDAKKILNYVSEEEVFELVFGFIPIEYEYVLSPFRKDKNPGCWFERTSSFTGKLRFIDFADSYGKPMDCFDAVKRFFKISNFYKTLEYVYIKLIKDKKNNLVKKAIVDTISKPKFKIEFESRNFLLKDKLFWEKYYISKNDLIEDKIFPVKKYKLLNTRKGDIMQSCYDVGYAYTEFNSFNKKLYFPYRKGKLKFVTTCTKNDIGGIKNILPYGEQLIITKSYKDYRVLLNHGKNVIWFQNEGMFPELDILLPIVKRFNQVIIFFDNDAQGISSSQKLALIINSYYPSKAIPLWLSEELIQYGITDPSDFIHKKGPVELKKFLKMFT